MRVDAVLPERPATENTENTESTEKKLIETTDEHG
jgi:hypothetical protein